MTSESTQLATFFANVGVPGILIALAVWCAYSERLARVAITLVGVTVMHFAFQALWAHINEARASTVPVIGMFTTGQFANVVYDYMLAPCARVWVGMAQYSPVAHDQLAYAFRWIIGGTV